MDAIQILSNVFFGEGFEGFRGEDGREVKVNCAFQESGALTVTVEDCCEDDVNPEKLLQFLKEKDVIKTLVWKKTEVKDTDGIPWEDESFVTFTFKRVN